ncbi:hypothetical protein [Roseicyclus sp.]|uniref:hypothetical protein n=1 Tax=Roseicyclus sp. TaxID=1914329 RepID=UPI003F6A9FC8
MKIQGANKLVRKLGQLPDAQRRHVVKAIAQSTEEAARVARTLAPDTTGRTRAQITTEYKENGLVGEVVVIDSAAPRAEKDRAYSIEHGRKRGDRGTTEGYHFVRRTRAFIGKKNRNRILRAIRKAAKEVAAK